MSLLFFTCAIRLPSMNYPFARANGDLFMGTPDSCETSEMTVPVQKGCAAMGNCQWEIIRII